ncbi:MAG: HD domain-containing protein [Bacillota bacterium]|nr:HD domain-containing protein [Bacillota bacterium]
MRLAKLDENVINKKLAMPVILPSNFKLADKGVRITEKLVAALKRYGFSSVYVDEPGIVFDTKTTLTDGQRLKIIRQLQVLYEKLIHNNFNEFELSRFIAGEILPEVPNGPVSLPLSKPGDSHDIAEHSLNVCLLSVAVARNLNLEPKNIEAIAKAALLHDFGKLVQNNKHNQGRHEEAAYEILKSNTYSVLVYTAVRFHHETIDGEGPAKLPKEKQNEAVRVLSLCNYYENLASGNSLLPHECFEKLQSLVNIKFDLHVYEAFKKSIYLYPVGLPVKLNNKKLAVVVGQNDDFPFRPIVRTENERYDLMKCLSLFIEEIVI